MKYKKMITILAIETSCDDTSIAIIEAGRNGSFKVLSNIVSSQTEIHKKWGGVYPTLAKREHQKNLVPVLIESMKKANMLKIQNTKYKFRNEDSKIKIIENILQREPYLIKRALAFFEKYQKPDIDLIAITNGPGLEPCLWVGVNFAKALAFYWEKPIITVNHIKAHIFVNELNKKPLTKKDFPAVCLIVSGGHTQLFLMTDFGKYKILGETRDDAAGECFDKTARILGLGYPGGPIIAKLASKKNRGPFSTFSVKLPRPMINTKDYDFSFSGLKTAVLYAVKKKYGQAPLRSAFSRTTEGRQYIKQMCVEIQQSIIDVLIKKTLKAAINYKAKTIILGGGVTANDELRKQFNYKLKITNYKLNFLVPPKNLCTDNATMTAIAGYFRWKKMGRAEKWQGIKAEANLRIE